MKSEYPEVTREVNCESAEKKKKKTCVRAYCFILTLVSWWNDCDFSKQSHMGTGTFMSLGFGFVLRLTDILFFVFLIYFSNVF